MAQHWVYNWGLSTPHFCQKSLGLYSTSYFCFDSGVALYRGDGVSRSTLDTLTVDAVDHISSKFNIIILHYKLELNGIVCVSNGGTYCKLANLGIINTHDFIIFGSTESESRNQVDDEKNDTAAEKRVCETRYRISKLVSELNVIVVYPATINLS